ncbi:MAG: glycosyltransferase [Phycisphaerae bacterium]
MGRKVACFSLNDQSKPYAAATIHLREDVRALRSLGWDATLYTQAQQHIQPDAECPIEILSRNRPFTHRLLFELRGARRLAEMDPKPDFVIFRSVSLGWIARQVIRLKIPFGIELPGTPAAFLSTRGDHYRKWSQNLMFRNADLVAALTGELAELVEPFRKPTSRVVVSGVGVDADKIELSKPLSADPKTGPTLGYIGTMGHERGLEQTVGALVELVAAGLDARMVLVGDGICRAEAEKQAAQAGLADRTTFTGYVAPEAISALVGNCDIILGIYPPTESLRLSGINPMKVWTSLAMGKPVLLFTPGKYNAYDNVPGIFCLDSIEPAAIARRFRQIWDQLGQSGLAQAGLQGRHYIRDNVSWQKHIEPISQAMLDILDA